MWKELKYPEGTILFDVKYHKKPECFEVIYLDPVTNTLEVKYEEAIVDIWFLKEEFRTNKYQIPQIEMDKCYPVYCKPSHISKAIADNIGGEYKEYYNKNSKSMSPWDMTKHMNECPWVFKSDFPPEVYFRLRWLQKYGDSMDISKVTYAFLDIETDVIDGTIDIKNIKDVRQPINAVTLILPEQKICAVHILGPRPKYKLAIKYHELLEKQTKEFDWLINHQEEFKHMIVDEDKDNKKYLADYEIRLHIFDFQDEIKMIKTVFDYINKYRPMFCLSWNAKFDDNYLMNRISYLGYDPKDFIIPKEIKTDMLYYKEDRSDKFKDKKGKKKSFSFKKSKDWFYSSSFTIYLCQMRLYAKIRKSKSEPRSYSLSAVGKAIAGIDKLTQTKSGAFRVFAYTDFLKFILYNVRDVVVQLAIEMNCNDCQSLVARSYMFTTPYPECFQETHIVRNCRESSFEENGYIQSNRLFIDPTLDTAFKGAFVAPTDKNKPTGLILNGKNTNVMMFGVLDADAKSYYPSTKQATNQDPMSLLYKCKIDNSVFINKECINNSFNQEYIWYDSDNDPHDEDMTGPIFNSFKNGNIMSVMSNWFGLPSVSDYFDYIDAHLNL